MLLARNKIWIDRARHLATQAREPVTHYEHREIGYNYRLSNILAGVGRAQFADLERRVDARRAINLRYRDGLGDLPISFMPEPSEFRSTYWLTCVTFASEGERDDVLAHLARLDIEARPVWKPMHLQPAFTGHRIFGGRVSEQLFRTGLCLPSGSSLTLPNQQLVIRSVREGLSSQALGLSAG
jgi:dTDP-4-amino-4,6-dideoxygalactose transaminase